MKILTVIGARPQFIKASAVTRAIQNWNHNQPDEGITEILVHTGQHFDENMSQVFFTELGLPAPDYNLNINGGTHGQMTGRMIEGLENILLETRPDAVLVYGDTNSTLAATVAAVKLSIPIAHVEAGLRSYNMDMPEEVNRILTDRVSSLLFCPTTQAITNLEKEGITDGVMNTGDVMYDVALSCLELSNQKSSFLKRHGLTDKEFILVTCHRQESTDSKFNLQNIADALNALALNHIIVLPLHPRTAKMLAAHQITLSERIMTIEPIPFLDMLQAEKHARMIITDSGGVQKEAYFYGVPCVTMREETEWTETVDAGWNRLAGTNAERIVHAAESLLNAANLPAQPPLYGDGKAAEKIVTALRHLPTRG